MQQSELVPGGCREHAARMAAALARLDDVVVAAHVNPDGDAVGSLAAARHILRALGRRFMLYARPGLPRYLDFFTLPAPLYTSLERPQHARALDAAASRSAWGRSWRPCCRGWRA